MKIISFKVFPKRNIYSHEKCIKLNLDLDDTKVSNEEIYDFDKSIIYMFPEFKSEINEHTKFITRHTKITYFLSVSKKIMLTLQNMIGIKICYKIPMDISIYDIDNSYIIYEYEYKNTGIEAAKITVDLINSLVDKKHFNLDLRLNRLKKILLNEQLGVSTLSICNEAKKRGIPILRLDENSMFQLGYGKFSKSIQATIGSDTSAIAVAIAQDKLLTKELLNMHFLPIARGMKVQNKLDAISHAKDIGYPLVLKPQFGNQGKGVISNIKNEEEFLDAYDLVFKNFKDIVIEKYIAGKDYRVCCIYGDIIAVSEKIPPYIIGDGIVSIRNLIEKVNKDSRRGDGHEKELTKIKIDDVLITYLTQRNYSLTTILSKNEKLDLKANANLSTGGFAIDCTDLICEENIEICKRAASAIGLDICGIDLICEDISKPLNREGAIIEINAAPGIRMHHNPYVGIKRNVAGHIVDKLFKDMPSSIPLITVIDTNDEKTTPTKLIAHILSLAGNCVGMATTSGIYINKKCIFKGDTTDFNGILAVLTDKSIDAAVLETSRTEIIKNGLGYNFSDIAVITNIPENYLGIDETKKMDYLTRVNILIGETVKKDGYIVINSDDIISINILNKLKCNLIIFSTDKNNPALNANIKNGGYGVYEDKGNIIIQRNTNTQKILEIKRSELTKCDIENTLAACCTSIGLGIDYNIIKNSLLSFNYSC